MAKAYNKQPLGRGLSALLDNPSEDIKSVEHKNANQIIGNVIELPINQINLNPYQPRTNFENEKINATSNKESIAIAELTKPIFWALPAGDFFLLEVEKTLNFIRLFNLPTNEYYKSY
mgnify:CR=1 FL=1